MNTPTIDVAVCVVQSPEGRVLLAERTARQVAAGFWELPGGKIEPGETPAEAAARELVEETGLTPTGLVAWRRYDHQFQTRRLRLHFFRARGWQGTAHGREGQRLAWVDPGAPHVGPLLPSNDRAMFALSLPASYPVLDIGAQDGQDDVLRRLHAVLSGGARLIRVRPSQRAPGQTTSLLTRIAALAGAFRGARILAPSVMDARRAGLAGVHSDSTELRRMMGRPAVAVWAATCHHQEDLDRAVALGADFVVLSPILADPERPHQAPLGWDGLRRLTAACSISVYAQGGLSHADEAAARAAGAAGLVVAAGHRDASERERMVA